MTLLYKQESYKIQGAIFEVYKEIGTGYLEAIYQESLEKELALSDIPYQAQKELTIHYKGVSLKQTYKPDLICYNNIIIELKAVHRTKSSQRDRTRTPGPNTKLYESYQYKTRPSSKLL